MFDTYLLIGATTPVGKYLVHEYSREGKSVRVLVPEEYDVSEYEKIGAEVYYGSTFDKDSMRDFFKVAEPRSSVVIHVDEIANFSGEKNLDMRRTNVAGTINVVDQCLKYKIGRLVYMSSAYAINELPAAGETTIHFDRTKVEGEYAKTKAEASAYVMEKVSLNKLNAVLLLPTFIMGPGFEEDSEMGRILKKYLEKGITPVNGGHAFVDVRDVAAAIVAVAENGERGACYIIAGEHKSTDEFFTDVCEAHGIEKSVKQASWLVNSRKLARLVDTYYKLLRKDNPKDVYALFRDRPDTIFESTVTDVLPDPNKTVVDSLKDYRDGTPIEDEQLFKPSESVEENEEAEEKDVEKNVETEAEKEEPEEKVEEKVEAAEVAEVAAAVEEKAEDAAEATEEATEDVVEETVEETEDVVEDKAEEVVEEATDEAAEEAEEKVEDAAEEVEDEIESATEEVEDEIEAATEEVEESAQDTAETIEEKADEVEETSQDTAEPVDEKAEDVAEVVAEAEEKAEEAIEETVEEAEDVVEETVEEAEEAAEEVEEKVEAADEPVKKAIWETAPASFDDLELDFSDIETRAAEDNQ